MKLRVRRNKLLYVSTIWCPKRQDLVSRIICLQLWQDQFSPLKYQTRSIAALPDGDGFALGGTEGRVAVHYFHDPPDPKDGKVYVATSPLPHICTDMETIVKSLLSVVIEGPMPTILMFLGMKLNCTLWMRLLSMHKEPLRQGVVMAQLVSGVKRAAQGWKVRTHLRTSLHEHCDWHNFLFFFFSLWNQGCSHGA